MTALHSSFATSSFHGHGPFDTMPDQGSDQDWQHQHQHSQQPNSYIPHMPMLTNQWAPQSQPQSNTQLQQHQQLLGMAGMDRRYFHDDTPPFMAFSSTGASNNLISPCFPAENAWSDIDMNTPSNFDSPQEPIESFIPNPPNHAHLLPPRVSGATRHSHAHAPLTSPHQEITDPMSVDRPSLPGRSHTEPVKGQHSARASKTANIKQSGSDESDEDFVPSESNQNSKPATTASNRGRKRQRIPHTAVERRYRENLNAHLERLRQTVPALASRRVSGNIPLVSNNHSVVPGHRASEPNTAPVGALLSDGAKPSKCEILNGAIEHIGAVERENAGLREEVKDLRTRVEDLQRWYSATLQTAGSSRGGGYVS
jgi:hypothetical protein